MKSWSPMGWPHSAHGSVRHVSQASRSSCAFQSGGMRVDPYISVPPRGRNGERSPWPLPADGSGGVGEVCQRATGLQIAEKIGFPGGPAARTEDVLHVGAAVLGDGGLVAAACA